MLPAPLGGFLGDVAVVLVLYGRALADSPTFRTLDGEPRAAGAPRPLLLVYDNSPAAAPLPDGVDVRWNLRHVHDPSNPGVSTAYRAGAALGAEHGKRWLLFFDQDTELPPGALAAYAAAIAEHPDEVVFAPALRSPIGAVSPCAYRFPVGRSLPALRPGVQPLRGVSLLNSGLCVERDTYDAVGGHDPRIPLDFSDHELVDRLRARVPRYVLVAVTLRHGLSAAERQSAAQRLNRFRVYCVGALRTRRRGLGRLLARSVVVARGAVLAWRWRNAGFLATGVRYGFGRE